MKKWILLLALLALLPGSSANSQTMGAPVYFVAGQAHPAFNLEIMINGQKIKTVSPSPDKAKIFLKQFDESILRSGTNSLEVTYRRALDKETSDPRMPSFRVTLKRQNDPMDKKTSVVLLKLKGPQRPFEDVPETETVSGEFEN
jgi:hypothetical protein